MFLSRFLIVVLLFWSLADARGDTLLLNNGTSLKNVFVMKNGDRYWVQNADGSSQFIPMDQTKQWIKDSDLPADSSTASTPTAGLSSAFLVARGKANAVEIAGAAVAIWNKFVATNPAKPDLDAAKQELNHWQKLAADNMEKINGRWVGGDERQKLLTAAEGLVKEGVELLHEQKTLAGIDKLKEAEKIYPNSYALNSELGAVNCISHKEDEALVYFYRCVKLRPDAVDALNNVAIVLWAKKQYAIALEKFRLAAMAGDSRILASNINKALATMPPDLKNSLTAKQAGEAANLLATKYNFPPDFNYAAIRFILMPPPAPKAMTTIPGNNLPSGVVASGSGFMIREDGLILTNRHVAAIGKSFTVLLDGGERVPADVVMIDKTEDLALLQLKTKKKYATVAFAANDLPAGGAPCYAMGFPLIDRLGATLKITQGIVSGQSTGSAVDILIDAKVNPGNSGGPLLDKNGCVMGIVTMKSLTSEAEDSYGMALSVGRIRRFLAQNRITPPPSGSAVHIFTAEEVMAKVRAATVCVLVSE